MGLAWKRDARITATTYHFVVQAELMLGTPGKSLLTFSSTSPHPYPLPLVKICDVPLLGGIFIPMIGRGILRLFERMWAARGSLLAR